MPVTKHPERHYRKEPIIPFLKGPVPLSWLALANAAGGSALPVGLCLWYLKGMNGATGELGVTRKRAKDTFGIGERALSRGLVRLESAGLITTTRGKGKAIRVTIVTDGPTKPKPQEPPL